MEGAPPVIRMPGPAKLTPPQSMARTPSGGLRTTTIQAAATTARLLHRSRMTEGGRYSRATGMENWEPIRPLDVRLVSILSSWSWRAHRLLLEIPAVQQLNLHPPIPQRRLYPLILELHLRVLRPPHLRVRQATLAL